MKNKINLTTITKKMNQQHPETSPINNNNKHLQSHEKQNQPHNNKEK